MNYYELLETDVLLSHY